MSVNEGGVMSRTSIGASLAAVDALAAAVLAQRRGEPPRTPETMLGYHRAQAKG
jgi:hypothetical protein